MGRPCRPQAERRPVTLSCCLFDFGFGSSFLKCSPTLVSVRDLLENLPRSRSRQSVTLPSVAIPLLESAPLRLIVDALKGQWQCGWCCVGSQGEQRVTCDECCDQQLPPLVLRKRTFFPKLFP